MASSTSSRSTTGVAPPPTSREIASIVRTISRRSAEYGSAATIAGTTAKKNTAIAAAIDNHVRSALAWPVEYIPASTSFRVVAARGRKSRPSLPQLRRAGDAVHPLHLRGRQSLLL